jgi:hypothetical protein
VASTNDEVSGATILEAKASSPSSPRIFISYLAEAHDHLHRDWVLKLANTLRREGVDARLDQHYQSPDEGWPRWLQRELQEADFVILVCTKRYCEAYLSASREIFAPRTHWEGALIRAHMYAEPARLARFVPVLRDDEIVSIPPPLTGFPAYPLGSSYEALYRRITSQPEVVPPAGGGRLALVPVEERTAVSGGAPESLDFKAWAKLVLFGLIQLGRRYRRTVIAFAVLLTVATTLYATNWARISSGGLEVGRPTHLIRCVQSARARDMAYVIESATLLWRISDSPQGDKRHLSLRSLYVVRSLRDYGVKSKTFPEWSGYDNARFWHWYAPDLFSSNSNDAQSYYVEYEGVQGELRTIVTGAEYEYELPRPDKRAGCKNKASPPLGSREEALRYPNDSDILCDLTIIVESDNTPLHLSGASLLVHGDNSRELRAVEQPDPALRNVAVRQRSLSVRVRDTMIPGDDVCLRYTW